MLKSVRSWEESYPAVILFFPLGPCPIALQVKGCFSDPC